MIHASNKQSCFTLPYAGPVKGAALIRLAFVTLGQHDFAYKPKYLEPVKMLGYLDDENESIRRAAALAFCRVLHRNAKMRKLAAAKKESYGHLYNGYKVWKPPFPPPFPPRILYPIAEDMLDCKIVDHLYTQHSQRELLRIVNAG